ncbi:MAG: YgiT-type zinc finger protein [Roseburia sp.]|nr:YgiT-type zinc finger protein [Roseburia sp.]
MPGQRYELHHKICNLRYGTHGYEMDAYEGMAKIIDDVKVAVCPECGNIEMYLENLTNLKD